MRLRDRAWSVSASSSGAGRQPLEGQVGEGGFDDGAIMPDLDRQDAFGIEVFGSLGEQAAHHVQPVLTRGERHLRLVQVFRRQGFHGLCGHVGRVAQDEVEAAAFQPLEDIAVHQLDAILQAVVGNVDARHIERVLRQVDRAHVRVRESVRHQDRQAARAGAHVEHAAYRLRILHPGREAVLEQLGEEGARHDHARIDGEAEVAQPGLAEDVGGGDALVDALLDGFEQADALLGRDAGVHERLQAVERQGEAAEDQPHRLVEAVLHAMAAEDAGAIEAGDGVA